MDVLRIAKVSIDTQQSLLSQIYENNKLEKRNNMETKSERQLKKEAREKEKLRKPLKTVVHPTRIIAYLVQVAIVYYTHDFLRNHFLMLVMWVILALPVFDLIAYIMLYRGISVELTAPEREVNRQNVGYLNLKLINTSYMISYDVNVKLDVENTFYKDSSATILSLPCSARSSEEKQLPIKYSMNGIYKYSISAITIRDMLGFVSVKKDIGQTAEVNVYPERELAAEVDMSDMNKGMTESEETVKKGHDFSDVSDVREYIPGDKLMSIHWKLSAKRDILMVKDRVAMSDQQMVILTELSGSDEDVDEVLTLTYAVTKRLVQDQTYVRLLWWSEGKYSFEERQIMSLSDLREAFTSIYYESIYYDPEKTRGYMLSIYPELKAYVKVCMKDGQPNVLILEQD